MPAPPRSKREYLQGLVAEKNRWQRPLTEEEKALGFLGWHERGYLPHCDYPELIQFVTMRLADSMPESRRGEWGHLIEIEDHVEKRKKLEAYLDRGMGGCLLGVTAIAKLGEEALLHHHEDRYELLAWCIMPNHIHVLVQVWRWPLWKMVQNWKVRIAMEARKLLRTERRAPARRGSETDGEVPSRCSALREAFWQREYWDTFMRDEGQEQKAVRYIEGNPVKAHLCHEPEGWPFSSGKFRDQFRRLAIPAKV